MLELLCLRLPFCVDVRRVAFLLRAASTHSGFHWSDGLDCDEVPPFSTSMTPDIKFGSMYSGMFCLVPRKCMRDGSAACKTILEEPLLARASDWREHDASRFPSSL